MADIMRSETVFKGRVFSVKRDHIVDKDRRFVVDVVVHRGAVVILPLIDSDVIAVKQFRYSVWDELVELPAGTLEEGEEPEKCAIRELEEETGYIAENIEYLGSFYASPGYCTEILHAFLAENLREGKMKLEPDEKIRVVKIPLNNFLKMIVNGDIKDSKTIATTFLYILKKSRFKKNFA